LKILANVFQGQTDTEKKAKKKAKKAAQKVQDDHKKGSPSSIPNLFPSNAAV